MGAPVQSWSGSGPEMFVLHWDPTILLFSQEVLPCSCSDMRLQGWLRPRPARSTPEEEPKVSCQEIPKPKFQERLH